MRPLGIAPIAFILALSALFALLSAPVAATPVLVQSTISTSVVNPSVAFGSNTTAGNLLVVLTASSSTLASVSDTSGNTYVKCGTETSTGFAFADIFITNAGAIGGADTVSFTGTGALAIAEYSGLVTSSGCDKSAGTSGFGTAVTTGATAVTTQNSEVAVCVVSRENFATSSAWGASFIEEQDLSGAPAPGFADKILSATGAVTCTTTLSGNNNWASIVSTLKASTGGGCTRTLLGVGCDDDVDERKDVR